jgi:putative oxidoreductase
VYRNWLDAPVSDSRRGLDIVRIAVALVQVVHPLHGLWSGGKWGADIVGFGHFLAGHGLPFGVFLAWSVIVVQILGVIGLLTRRLVPVSCLALIAVLAVGIALVHAEAGWFVVGAGEGGMEFSVLLIACLGGIFWAHRPRGEASNAGSV